MHSQIQKRSVRRILIYCVASAASAAVIAFYILLFVHVNQGDSIIQTGPSTQTTKENTVISENQNVTSIPDEVSVNYRYSFQ